MDASNLSVDVAFKKHFMNNSKLFGVETEGCPTVEYIVKKQEDIPNNQPQVYKIRNTYSTIMLPILYNEKDCNWNERWSKLKKKCPFFA